LCHAGNTGALDTGQLDVNLTDTHCHLDLDQFDSDREAVLERAALAGVRHILIPGLSVTSSQAVLKLAVSHPMLHAAVGVHPTEASTWSPKTRNELKALTSGTSGAFGTSGTSGTSKILAIGEIGLDYYWDSAPHDIQRNVLRTQLELAAETGLPVILHMREARDALNEICAGDLLHILEEWVSGLRAAKNPLAERPGVLHSFSGSLETAHASMRLGFYIGVTGPVTFENAKRRQEIVTALPLERILIETDAPYLAPHPLRGKRNEPAYVRLIADKIALIHSCNLEKVATTTRENATRLFAWKETT
jgi:TatD DNase family protein